MDAFDATIGEQIPWLPDETLFSWCSRYHYLAVNGLASATCLQLFGRRRQGVAHDLPSGITELAERARGSLGTASDIIRDRTILSFYAPFRSTELIADAVRRISGDGIDALKYRLGLLTSGLGAAHPLKTCASCMRDDRERFRVAYWHRVHQLPSTWFCPIHAEQLLVSPLKLNQRARFQWVLPQDAWLAEWRQLTAAR